MTVSPRLLRETVEVQNWEVLDLITLLNIILVGFETTSSKYIDTHGRTTGTTPLTLRHCD
jgi:hypothetical protein